MCPSPHDASIKQIADYVNIIKADRTSISGEVVLTTTQQITKPFVKKHFRSSQFPTDADVKSGDLLIRGHQRYLVIELSEKFNQKEFAYYDGISYKTNFSGEIQRKEITKTEFGNSVNVAVIERDVYGVLDLWSDVLAEQLPGDVETGKLSMLIPANISGEIGDSIIVNSGEIDRYDKYRILTTDMGTKFEGVKFVTLELDSA